MFGIGTQELILILAIVLVLFGGKKLPELSRNLGKTLHEIRKGLMGEEGESEKSKKKKEEE